MKRDAYSAAIMVPVFPPGTFNAPRVLDQDELDALSKDSLATRIVARCSMLRGPLCSWCHADYYTQQGAHAHGDDGPYARRCMRCGQPGEPSVAPVWGDYLGSVNIEHHRRPIVGVAVNRCRLAIEAMALHSLRAQWAARWEGSSLVYFEGV